MRKHFFTSVTMLGFLLTLAVASVHAQSSTKIEVSIPFDFTVGNSNLHPGKYTVTARGTAALMIRSKDGGSTAMRLTNAIHNSEPSAKTKLVFRQYGERYFLSEVWTVGENSGRQILQSRQELALERNLATMASKSNLTRAGNRRVEIFAAQ